MSYLNLFLAGVDAVAAVDLHLVVAPCVSDELVAVGAVSFVTVAADLNCFIQK